MGPEDGRPPRERGIATGTLVSELWKEVGRHLHLEEVIDRLAAMLAPSMPADEVLIRVVDAGRQSLETVAFGMGRPGRAPSRARTECSPPDFDRIVAWCGADRVERAEVRALEARLPGLVPAGLEGEVLAAPLKSPAGQLGAVVLVAAPRSRFFASQEVVIRELRDPLGVALENDQRLRELVALREAVEAENRGLLSRLGRHDISDSVVGAESGLREVMEQIELVARSDAPVLVLGETGSGKEVVARAIHRKSRRASGPIMRVNCGAIAPELVDSELFGHERGSFTGAVNERKGWFERADGGTLFLDECGELPPAVQVRLLRILQDGQFERVGGEKPRRVDVRIVAATHRDLQAMAAAGRFRQDLWYRLAVFPIRLPPLRERAIDIPALAAHFAERAASRLGSPPLAPEPGDVAQLLAYAWPGNVRELAAVIERAAILGNGKRLAIAQALGNPVAASPPVPSSHSALPAELDQPAAAVPAVTPNRFPTLDDAIRQHIERALERTRGRVEGRDGAASVLGVNPHTLRSRMRKLGVDWARFRGSGAES
jgi:transcriptional regulator with GAF, ATPase, and Fis domain